MNRKEFIHKVGIRILSMGEKYFQKVNAEKAERRGKMLTSILFRLDKKHRNRTLENLKLAFPELNESQRFAFAKRNYDHFGCVLSDFLRTPMRTDEDINNSTEVVGREIIERLMAEGRGILLLSAHFGNWERMTHWLPMNGIPLTGIARDANDSAITEKLSKVRAGRGMEILSRGNAAREMLRRLKDGQTIGMMPDQNADDAYIPFFGHPAGTVLGPAVIHRKTKSPVLFACCLRKGVGRYQLMFFEPIELREGETNEEFTIRINAEIERMIRLAPEQYLWMHDRWKNARNKGLL